MSATATVIRSRFFSTTVDPEAAAPRLPPIRSESVGFIKRFSSVCP
jgi:hypothetical protein